MPSNLLTAIVNDRTRSVNFFNGRLLTGEDLTAEQKSNRVAHSLLGQAVGSGVAYGLEVSESATLSTVAAHRCACRSNPATLLRPSRSRASPPTRRAKARPAVAISRTRWRRKEAAPRAVGALAAPISAVG